MKHFALLLSLIAVLFLLVSQTEAEVLFRAFHETEPPVPNEKVEDPEEWSNSSVSPGANVFKVAASGRLEQTGNECAATTKNLLPVVDGANWTDYTVSFDVWWKDDDGISLIFRYTDDQNYYSFTTGGTDDHYKNNWYLGPAIFTEKACFGDGGETGDAIDQGPTGLNVDSAGPFTMMIRVQGTKIEAFFGEQVSQTELAAGKTPPKMVEVNDDRFKKGAIAIGTSTCPAEFANIIVSSGTLAVDAKGKLTTAWGTLRSAN